MSFIATIKQILSIKDTSSNTYVKSSDASRTWAGTGDIEVTLNATSTPAIDGGVATLVAMTAGAATIDLTALVHLDGDTRTAAGKKLRELHFYNPSNNNIRIKTGASNGHIPVGSAFDVTIPPGGAFTLYLVAAATAITNSSNDTIDISGTTTDSVLMKAVWGA